MEFVSSLLLLNPGVYILRHPKTGTVPLSVSRAPGSQKNNGRLEVIGTPGTDRTILRDGSDCLVMHIADAPVELLVTAYMDQPGAAVPALRVDRVALDGAPAEPAAAPVAGKTAAAARATNQPIQIPANGLSVIGHMERMGDLVATGGELLGEPDANLRLEGFQVMWPDRPQGADLAYNIAVEGIGPLPVVKTGKFCGTRGQARRITEATFSLVGPQAKEFQLEGTAYFTGGFQMPVESGQPLGGPSGLEHLTALSLNVVKAKTRAKPAPNPWDASPRTKVFKSRTGSANAEQPAVKAPVKKAASKAAPPAKAVAVKAASGKKAPATTAVKAQKAAKTVAKAAPKPAAKAASKASVRAGAKAPVKSSTKAAKAATKK